jgi:hypothetical protein
MSDDIQGKSYLEILAENDAEARREFEPNAKDLLIEHNEYEDDVDGNDEHPDELEEQEAFQKPIGSYHAAAESKPAPAYKNVTKLSVTYNTKDVTTHIFNIGSKFRSDNTQPPTNFTYRFLKPLKNIISIRISSLEVPNTWYTFNQTLYNNVSFSIVCPAIATPTRSFTLPEGNYADGPTFASAIQSTINSAPWTGLFTVSFSQSTSRLTVLNIAGNPFTLNFSQIILTTGLVLTAALKATTQIIRPYQNGIGYNMGFRNKSYSGAASYTGEMAINISENNYIFLSLGPDFPVVTHTSLVSQKTYFSKILVNVPKNTIIFDDGSNTLTKEYFFRQPSNVISFQVMLFDEYEQVLDLNGADFSFTVELVEVINQSLLNELQDA